MIHFGYCAIRFGRVGQVRFVLAKKRSERNKKPIEQAPEPVVELHEQIWAVVAFDGVIATDLTYDQAAEIRVRESGKGKSGVCVVTKVVADRLQSE